MANKEGNLSYKADISFNVNVGAVTYKNLISGIVNKIRNSINTLKGVNNAINVTQEKLKTVTNVSSTPTNQTIDFGNLNNLSAQLSRIEEIVIGLSSNLTNIPTINEQKIDLMSGKLNGKEYADYTFRIMINEFKEASKNNTRSPFNFLKNPDKFIENLTGLNINAIGVNRTGIKKEGFINAIKDNIEIINSLSKGKGKYWVNDEARKKAAKQIIDNNDIINRIYTTYISKSKNKGDISAYNNKIKSYLSLTESIVQVLNSNEDVATKKVKLKKTVDFLNEMGERVLTPVYNDLIKYLKNNTPKRVTFKKLIADQLTDILTSSVINNIKQAFAEEAFLTEVKEAYKDVFVQIGKDIKPIKDLSDKIVNTILGTEEGKSYLKNLREILAPLIDLSQTNMSETVGKMKSALNIFQTLTGKDYTKVLKSASNSLNIIKTYFGGSDPITDETIKSYKKLLGLLHLKKDFVNRIVTTIALYDTTSKEYEKLMGEVYQKHREIIKSQSSNSMITTKEDMSKMGLESTSNVSMGNMFNFSIDSIEIDKKITDIITKLDAQNSVVVDTNSYIRNLWKTLKMNMINVLDRYLDQDSSIGDIIWAVEQNTRGLNTDIGYLRDTVDILSKYILKFEEKLSLLAINIIHLGQMFKAEISVKDKEFWSKEFMDMFKPLFS